MQAAVAAVAAAQGARLGISRASQSERGWTAGGQCFPNWAVLHMLQKSLRPSKGAMAR